MSKLHLVFGGRVSGPQGLDFTDLHNLDVVGLYPDYKSAEKAWRSAAQRTAPRRAAPRHTAPSLTSIGMKFKR